MTPEDFAFGLRESVVEDNLRLYVDILQRENAENITDDYWKRVRAFYETLSQDEQEIIRMIMRQVTVDAVSNVLAIIDGVSGFKDQEETLELIANGKTPKTISGYLQDAFLALQDS